MLTVACVLRSGGDFTPSHVDHLRDGVARNLSLPHRFCCLSDMEVDCERIPLRTDWPGWFSKLEMLKPGLFWGPVVSFDLDVVITGSLDDLVLGHRFTVCDDFYHPGQINSSMMAWNTDLSDIFMAFGADPERNMRTYRTRAHWGDQGFIRDHSPVTPDRWQWKYPGRVVSFKADVLKDRRVLDGASVCIFHGRPRPWELGQSQRAWFERVSEAA